MIQQVRLGQIVTPCSLGPRAAAPSAPTAHEHTSSGRSGRLWCGYTPLGEKRANTWCSSPSLSSRPFLWPSQAGLQVFTQSCGKIIPKRFSYLPSGCGKAESPQKFALCRLALSLSPKELGGALRKEARGHRKRRGNRDWLALLMVKANTWCYSNISYNLSSPYQHL